VLRRGGADAAMRETLFSIHVQPVSWRPMLQAVPRRNAAADAVRRPDGTLAVHVRLRRPRWAVPPITWVVHLTGRRTVNLDAVGTAVWDWADGRHTVEDVIDEFSRRYSLTFHEARAAVTGFLGSLVKRGVLAIEHPTPPAGRQTEGAGS